MHARNHYFIGDVKGLESSVVLSCPHKTKPKGKRSILSKRKFHLLDARWPGHNYPQTALQRTTEKICKTSQVRINSFSSSSVLESEEKKNGAQNARTRAYTRTLSHRRNKIKIRNGKGYESRCYSVECGSARERSLPSFPPRHRVFPNMA